MSDKNLAHQTLGRYQLLVAIARGGMGQVWLARLHGARGFNKLVAIKTLLPAKDEENRLEQMLLEEARIAALIHHPNVAQTLELGEHEGTLYMAMEWVDGEPLGFVVKRAAERGGMSFSVAATLMSQVLSGLHAAHELRNDEGPLGVVHRDVSPHNILITYEGVAKLLDFGIAKATNQLTSNTEAGEIKGKFSYMSPEQILGGAVDRRCDVFAAGIILYLLTVGRHPFKTHSTAGVLHSITSSDPPPSPSQLVEGYPEALEAVVMKALEKDLEKRWESAEEMRIALERAVPLAFGVGGKAELREFMERVLSDRKVARHEAIRRAQLAADAREVQSGPRPALQSETAQSASSLRAISVSQAAPENEPLMSLSDLHPDTERGARVAAAARRKRTAVWLGGASAGLVLALLIPLLFRGGSDPAGVAQGVSAGVEMMALAPEAPAAVAQPSTGASSASSASAQPAVAPHSATVAPTEANRPPQLKRSGVASAPPKKLAKTSPAPTNSKDDLIAPDYAR